MYDAIDYRAKTIPYQSPVHILRQILKLLTNANKSYASTCRLFSIQLLNKSVIELATLQFQKLLARI